MFFNYKLHPLGPLFLTWINFNRSMNSYLMKQFAHNWYLPCCQCTETCPRVSFIQNNIYMPVPGVSSPVESCSCPESTRCCSQWASSTGLTVVSKFKPRLPAQWAVGTHRKGSSRMEKGLQYKHRFKISFMYDNISYASILDVTGYVTLNHTDHYWPYRKTSNISGTIVVINIVGHSDVFGASLVGAAPTTSSLST